jgi:hypothetical protein
MAATDVLAAAEQCARFLASTVIADRTAWIPDMDWSVAQAVAHAAEAPLWYAFDLTADSAELTTLEVRVKPESAPADLVATLVTAARVLVRPARPVSGSCSTLLAQRRRVGIASFQQVRPERTVRGQTLHQRSTVSHHD